MSAAGSVDLAKFGNQSHVGKFGNELGYSRHTQFECFCQFRDGVVPSGYEMRNDVLLDLYVFRTFVAF